MKSIGFAKFILLAVFLCANSVKAVEPEYFRLVENMIATFKSGNSARISNLISYPLRRAYPIPPIGSREELIARFSEVFDDRLIQMIIDSDIERDWSAVGSEGIMLLDGTLWLDYNGKIIAVNYESETENAIEARLNVQQKAALHESLKDFEKPVLEWKTKKFHIRIDDLGDHHYRYASWSVDKLPGQKPDLVLLNGELRFDGSGGNHAYIFTSGPYRYQCSVIVLGANDSPPGTLEVFKMDRLLLTQPVIEVLGH